MTNDIGREANEQVEQLLAAMAAVPAHPQADFIHQQWLLLRQWGCRLGAAASTDSCRRAAAKLDAQQALVLLRVALQVQVADADADTLIRSCALLCGCVANDSTRSAHLTALLPVAMRALDQPQQQRAAVLTLGMMLSGCSDDELAAVPAAAFMDAAAAWLPTFSPADHAAVLSARCGLAQQPLQRAMASQLPRPLADGDTTEATSAAATLLCVVQLREMSLRQLFASREAAAAVAARLVQLLADASHGAYPIAWLICAALARPRMASLSLLLDAGLMQPALFARAMASGDTSIRNSASELIRLCVNSDRDLRMQMAEAGVVPVILTACADADRGVAVHGVFSLALLTETMSDPRRTHQRLVILQACSQAAFPSPAVIRLAHFDQQDVTFRRLIHAMMLMLDWAESAVDQARLHPLAQRMVDIGLLPLIEDWVRRPQPAQLMESISQSLDRTWELVDFLLLHFYGRSRIAVGTAFLGRQDRWLREQVAAHAAATATAAADEPTADESYWFHIGLVLQQLDGMVEGYNATAPADRQLSLLDFWQLNDDGDRMDLDRAIALAAKKKANAANMAAAKARAAEGAAAAAVAAGSLSIGSNVTTVTPAAAARFQQVGRSAHPAPKLVAEMSRQELMELVAFNGHCSALVKLTEDDLLVGHNTWADYDELIYPTTRSSSTGSATASTA